MSEDLVTITVDGQKLEAPKGAMLIEVTDKAGINIPRFCYHKKLSVAANCRMCLVDVEKAPKPLPACATPVMDGMVVHTRSPKAIAAQKGTMEFLLINHPLDCPICDQGGECELQDIAVGYGNDVSQYTEGKRVVFDRNIGPLIATEFTRCIHCTRCVRFGEEIAGMRELGATGRGERTQIGTFVAKSVASEMSGNVIDLCPVGALTAKPSRYAARAWEMLQYPSVAPHDSVGSNLYIHTLRDKVVRVVPRDNEALNEVWISDRDRFSYQGIYSDDRLATPLIKRKGDWQQSDWETAIHAAVDGVQRVVKNFGADQVGALSSATATLEELYLLQKLVRGIGSPHIDHRLRQTDFSDQQHAPVMPWLGMGVQDIEQQNAFLLIGSNVRKEQPIIAHRMRKAVVHHGASASFINPRDYSMHFPVAHSIANTPQGMLDDLAAVVKLAFEKSGQAIPSHLTSAAANASVNDTHGDIINALNSGGKSTVMLGNLAVQHPQYAVIRALAAAIAEQTGSTLSYLPEQANTAGAWLAGVVPHRNTAGQAIDNTGLSATDMLAEPRKAYVNLNIEPEFDCADSAVALDAMNKAEFVVVMTPFVTEAMKNYADVILPIATFAETSGTYVNAEGYWQSFKGCVSPQGESRPAWKVLRVLGNQFDLDGFEYLSSADIKDEIKQHCADVKLDNHYAATGALEINSTSKTVRLGEVPIYATDILVRRASALQQTDDANVAYVRLNTSMAKSLKAQADDKLSIKQNDKTVVLPLVLDDGVPDGSICVPVAIKETAALGNAFGTVVVEKI